MSGEQAPESPELAGLLVSLDHLRQAERRAASARMVSVIGHLIGTPLNVIAGRAGLMRTSPSSEGVEENARRIEGQVDRLAQRIRRLIDYFGVPEPRALPRPLGAVLTDCLAIYGPIASGLGVSLRVSAEEVETLLVDGESMPLLLTTLLSLALRSSARGASVTLNATEHGTQLVAFELVAPGLSAPPGRLDRLEPPDPGVQYDAGVLETLWLCLGLAKRLSGNLDILNTSSGATIRFECSHG